jgi:hypothetical protein
MLEGQFRIWPLNCTHRNMPFYSSATCTIAASNLPDQTQATTSWSLPLRCQTKPWNEFKSKLHQNKNITYDFITISPSDSPSGVTASMTMLAPNIWIMHQQEMEAHILQSSKLWPFDVSPHSTVK